MLLGAGGQSQWPSNCVNHGRVSRATWSCGSPVTLPCWPAMLSTTSSGRRACPPTSSSLYQLTGPYLGTQSPAQSTSAASTSQAASRESLGWRAWWLWRGCSPGSRPTSCHLPRGQDKPRSHMLAMPTSHCVVLSPCLVFAKIKQRELCWLEVQPLVLGVS